MGIWAECKSLGDPQASVEEREAAAAALAVHVERLVKSYARKDRRVGKTYAQLEDVVQDTITRILLGQTWMLLRDKETVPEEQLDKICATYVKRIIRTSVVDFYRKAKVEHIRLLTHVEEMDRKESSRVGGLPEMDFVEALSYLVDYVADRESRRGRLAYDNIQQTWREIQDLYYGRETLPRLVNKQLGRSLRGKPSEDKEWKKEYNKICKRHQRFREKLMKMVHEFVVDTEGNMIEEEVLKFAMKQVF